MHELAFHPIEPLSGSFFPYFEADLQAGFPSPADDYLQQQLNLHEYLVKHPAATFFVKVSGDSMKGAGIFSGDLLVVDRSIAPQNGKIVVAILNGGFTVKRLRLHGKKVWLLAENPAYPPIEICEENDFQVWGIVTYVIHQCIS